MGNPRSFSMLTEAAEEELLTSV